MGLHSGAEQSSNREAKGTRCCRRGSSRTADLTRYLLTGTNWPGGVARLPALQAGVGRKLSLRAQLSSRSCTSGL
eukprot:3819386-Amphidinium_carterae.1